MLIDNRSVCSVILLNPFKKVSEQQISIRGTQLNQTECDRTQGTKHTAVALLGSL